MNIILSARSCGGRGRERSERVRWVSMPDSLVLYATTLRVARDTSPSRRAAPGPSLSPLRAERV
jgi:predicted Fe-S protein YdhL (DUF1289 family)